MQFEASFAEEISRDRLWSKAVFPKKAINGNKGSFTKSLTTSNVAIFVGKNPLSYRLLQAKKRGQIRSHIPVIIKVMQRSS